MCKKESSNHNAKETTFLGVEYQYYVALDYLLKINNWNKCLIEEHGDVTFVDDNDKQILNIEVKHNIEDKELKLHDKIFQNTICNWFHDKEKYTKETKLIFVTTRKIPEDNHLSKWNNSDIEEKYKIIIDNSKKTNGEFYAEIKKYFNKIKDDNKIKDLLNKIEIIDSYPKYPKIIELIKNRNALKVFRNRKDKNEKVLHKVIDNLHRRISKNLEIDKQWEITYDEFIEVLREEAKLIRGINDYAFQQLLKDKYNDKKNFQYIGLDIIEIKKEEENQEDKRIISLTEPMDIFNYSSKSLIYGKAGVGKTTFCEYLSWQWAKNEKKIKEKFDYLIHTSLRQWKNGGLKGLIKSNHSSEDDEKILLVFKNNNEKILFLFDGYDELSNEKKSLLRDEIKKNDLQNYIITSRPHGYEENDFDDIKLYEIKGFNDKGIDSFVDNFFNNSEKQRAIKKFLYQNSNIKNICVVPLLLNMICTLWQQDNHLDKNITTTKIYSKIIDNILITHEDKNVYFRENRTRIKNILRKLSFESLKNNQIMFSGDLIEELFDYNEIQFFRKGVISTGFIKAISENRDILDNDLEFAHLTFQEYFSAYYVSSNNIKSSYLKEKFGNEYKFFQKFENMIIYLTNMNSKYVDKFIDFDPFIFREHPLLTKNQQEKLLLSIIDKIQNSEYLVWNREYLFDNTTLTQFDKIDNIYSLIKNKNIENSKNDILLRYIMKVFSKNYSRELEDFVFKILEMNHNMIYSSYNTNPKYNIRLFNFMKKHKLFNKNDEIVAELFYVLVKEKFPFENIFYLLEYLNNEDFKNILIILGNQKNLKISDIKEWFNYILNNDRNFPTIHYEDKLKKNIEHLIYLFVFSPINDILEKLIHFCNINFDYEYDILSHRKYINIFPLFYSISNDFWNIYFSDKIQDFSKVRNFIEIYHIGKKEIKEMQKKYPFEDYFIKTFELLEYLNNKQGNDEKFLVLEEEQLNRIIEKFKHIKKSNERKYFIKLLAYNYSVKLDSLIFKLLENFIKNNWIDYNLFSILESKFKMYLFKHISYEGFFYKIDSITIYNIEKWFNYFVENYDEKLSKDSYYNECIDKIIYKILSRDEIKDKPIERIILFLKDKNILIDRFYFDLIGGFNLNEAIELEFNAISDKFWNIYFSDKIGNFEEIKDFISLYNIGVKDIEIAKIEYNISANNHKYMDIKKNYLTSSDIEELEYRKNIQENNLKESWFEIYEYALQKSKNNFIILNKKLKEDLSQEQYNIFISIVIYIYREFNVKIQKNISSIPIHNHSNFLFSTLSINRLEKFISTKEEKENFFYWIIFNLVFIYNPVKIFIKNNFDIFINVTIECIKLSLKPNKEFSPYLANLKNNLDESDFLVLEKKIINFIVSLKDSDFELLENDFLQIISSDLNQYEFIENKLISSKNPFIYLSCLRKMNPNKTDEYYYELIQKRDSKYILEDLLDILNTEAINVNINKVLDDFYRYRDNDPRPNSNLFDKLLDVIKMRFIDYKDLSNEFIERILTDYYKFSDEKERNYHYISNHPITKIWKLLENDKKYIPLLQGLKEEANKDFTNHVNYCLLKLYDKEDN